MKRFICKRFFTAVLILVLAAGILSGMAYPYISDNRECAIEAAYEPDKWNLILVNRDYCIPENYEVELVKLDNGGARVDRRILSDLQHMFDDMRQEGLDPVVGQGYRTNQEQKKLLFRRILEFQLKGHSRRRAAELAKEWVAEPGTSEHELGIAVDINSVSGGHEYDIYCWLSENAHSYGFILRYPQGKQEITGIAYEPWHYRYVGTDAAEEIYDADITLEEYLAR